MRIIRQSSEDEMVLAFLRAEIDSPDFKRHLKPFLGATGYTRNLIDNADLKDEAENKARASCLSFRGFKKNTFLFEGFPDNVRWKILSLSFRELSCSKYANHPTWITLSRGTRLVSSGAENVDRISNLTDTTSSIKTIEKEIRKGVLFPELILVATREDSDLLLVEGHKRATAFIRAKDGSAEQIEVIAGYSREMSKWRWY